MGREGASALSLPLSRFFLTVLSTESVVYCEAKFSRPAKNFVLFSRKFLQGFCSATLRICYTTHIPFISASSTIGLDPFSDLKVSYLTIFLYLLLHVCQMSQKRKNQWQPENICFSVRKILEEKALLTLFLSINWWHN